MTTKIELLNAISSAHLKLATAYGNLAAYESEEPTAIEEVASTVAPEATATAPEATATEVPPVSQDFDMLDRDDALREQLFENAEFDEEALKAWEDSMDGYNNYPSIYKRAPKFLSAWRKASETMTIDEIEAAKQAWLLARLSSMRKLKNKLSVNKDQTALDKSAIVCLGNAIAWADSFVTLEAEESKPANGETVRQMTEAEADVAEAPAPTPAAPIPTPEPPAPAPAPEPESTGGAPSGYKMIGAYTYQQMLDAGWTDENLIAQGHMLLA